MKTTTVPAGKILLPAYILSCLEKLDWLEKSPEGFHFYNDDFIVVLYGVRGSTAFSGPDHIRYGSNTTSYQIWSPKLPTNILYLGDGGSGVLEADKAVMHRLFAHGINPFTATTGEVSDILAAVINTYTHYHYDHLHTGAPLAGLFNANSIPKRIIGGDNPRSQFVKTFKRPAFPRDFGEVQAAYSFHDIADPRSSVLIFTPNGEYRVMSSSDFASFISSGKPQIRHNKVFYDLEDCLVVRCYAADHPDPCISYRYENYNSQGEVVMAFTFMTDHEIRETDDRNSYFINHVNDSDVVYFDGQYTAANFIPGFGHGRVEIIGETAARMNLRNVLIGHHDPKRTDSEIDAMVELAQQHYREARAAAGLDPGETRIVGASDRIMVFIPSRERGRKGVVFGRMDLHKDQQTVDGIGPQATVLSQYKSFDLTQTYRLDDYTTAKA